ncbi:Transcriptional elongation regulator MINIYO [Linum perenne]
MAVDETLASAAYVGTDSLHRSYERACVADVSSHSWKGVAESTEEQIMRVKEIKPVFSGTSNGVSSFGVAQRSTGLESEIDAENHARIQNMSPEEIAEARAELMEKMNPSLLNLLKRRGQQKLNKQSLSESDVATKNEPANGPPNSSKSWNTWSERVEAARRLRFSLEGNVISADYETGCTPNEPGDAISSVAERDFLRTEGDPGAAGYSIHEAVQLTRSVVIFGRQIAIFLHRCTEKLLPPLEKCVGQADGYLEPVENDEAILDGYVKSWVSGALDRAATRGSMAFTLSLHHLSSFIFGPHPNDTLTLRNKLARSLIRDYSQKPNHQDMMLELVKYSNPAASPLIPDDKSSTENNSPIAQRFEVLVEACDGNSSLLSEVEKLKSALTCSQ